MGQGCAGTLANGGQLDRFSCRFQGHSRRQSPHAAGQLVETPLHLRGFSVALSATKAAAEPSLTHCEDFA
jgi:hypothetical protein